MSPKYFRSENHNSISLSRLFRRINDIESDLKQTVYFENCVKELKRIFGDTKQSSLSEIVCFGIGHFGDCSISRHQLAFIVAIKSEFSVPRCTFHEPILSRSEQRILQRLQCDIHSENLEGKLAIETESLVLIYSPHCPKQLTNNLLWRNWAAERLERIIYVGNSFTNLLQSTPSRFLNVDAKFIVKIQPLTREIVLENKFKFTDIFNDTSIHTFPSHKLRELATDFWSDSADEPIYSAQAIELITSDLIDKLTI